jgi:hypothetical protein
MIENLRLPTRGHKQCLHFARGIIPQSVLIFCNRMPLRFAIRTAHTAKRWAQGKNNDEINQALFFYIFEKSLDYEYFRAEIKDI